MNDFDTFTKENVGKLIVTNGLKKLPKVKKIAQSGHTGYKPHCVNIHYSQFMNALRL